MSYRPHCHGAELSQPRNNHNPRQTDRYRDVVLTSLSRRCTQPAAQQSQPSTDRPLPRCRTDLTATAPSLASRATITGLHRPTATANPKLPRCRTDLAVTALHSASGATITTLDRPTATALPY